jgi:Rho-binding antiterminator
MTPHTARYHPISCEFHDLLESLATTRERVRIELSNEEGEIQGRTVAITDVYARNGEEFIVTSTGQIVRLDRLVAVNQQTCTGECRTVMPAAGSHP